MATAKSARPAKNAKSDPLDAADDVPSPAPETDRAALRVPDPELDLPGFVKAARAIQALDRAKLMARMKTTAANHERYGSTALRGLRVGFAVLFGRSDRMTPTDLVDEVRGMRVMPDAARLGLFAPERIAFQIGLEDDSDAAMQKITEQLEMLARRHRVV